MKFLFRFSMFLRFTRAHFGTRSRSWKFARLTLWGGNRFYANLCALLPADAQPPMRDLFRRYLDSRIEVYRKVPDMEAVKAEQARSAKLQSEIWALAVSSTRGSGNGPGADAALARAERNVRHHHDANRGR